MPLVSLSRAMWYSEPGGYASNCQPNSEPQKARASSVSSTMISVCTI